MVNYMVIICERQERVGVRLPCPLQRNNNYGLTIKTLTTCEKRFSYSFSPCCARSHRASEKLAALLSTGLFVQLNMKEDLDIDYSDSSIYEIDPSLPEINRDLTPQELEALILEDIHSIYEGTHAV